MNPYNPPVDETDPTSQRSFWSMLTQLLKHLMDTSEKPSAPVAMTTCPTCEKPIELELRYSRLVCIECHDLAEDHQGRRLAFSNASVSGGFKAVLRDTQEPVASHVCFINGVQCWADEAHFGGIVIQANSKAIPDFMTEEEYDRRNADNT